MVEKVADLEQMLATHFHSHEQKQIENAKEELRLEQQQLYQLINVFEVILTLLMLNIFFINFKESHENYFLKGSI